MTVRVVGAGAISSIGLGLPQNDASLRAKIARFKEETRSPHGTPVVMGLVPDEVLEPALDAVDPLLRTPWQSRIVALAGQALVEAAPEGDAPLAMMVGLPDPREMPGVPSASALWAALERLTGRRIDEEVSQIFPVGRAAAFSAIEAGIALSQTQPSRTIVCGAVDSYADIDRVGRELEGGRTLGADAVSAGRPLGEAAAFVSIATGDRPQRGAVEVQAVAVTVDPGHRFSAEPMRAEGVSDAIERLRQSTGTRRPFARVWAGINGELYDGKSWGVAALRHRELFDERTELDHPADRVGDCGAGLGALLFATAWARLRAERRSGPWLLWATSDYGTCAAASMRHESDTGVPS